MRLLVAAATLVLTAGFSAAWEAPPVVVYEAAPAVQPDTTVIFPGAIGWAADRSKYFACDTHNIWRVTNTNDRPNGSSPPPAGSFRAAMDSAAANDGSAVCNTVLFTVGGRLHLVGGDQRYDDLHNLRISGQMASGGGVTMSGARIILRRPTGVVLEYFRSRLASPATNIFFQCGKGVYHQHLSYSWANAGGGHNLYTISCHNIEGDSEDATFHRVLGFEPNESHPTLMNLQAGAGSVSGTFPRAVVHESLLSGPGHRIPRATADSVVFIRNIAYNADARSHEYRSRSEDNLAARSWWIQNMAKPGPSTGSADHRRMAMRIDQIAEATSTGTVRVTGQRSFYNDFAVSDPEISFWEGANRTLFCRSGPDSSWSGCATDAAADPVPSFVRATFSLPTAATPAAAVDTIQELTDTYIEEVLMPSWGNSRRLQCDGQWGAWGSARDSIDARAVSEVANGTGASSTINVYSNRSFGDPASGTPCLDSDGDGLPDEYEFAQVGDSTGLPADSIVNGFAAYQWFLSGMELGGGDVGGGPAPGPDPEDPITQTFGSGHRVYLVEVTQRGDVLGPDPAVIPIPTRSITMAPPGSDSVLVCTLTDLGTPLDSATVHAVMASWFATTAWRASYLRDQCP